MSDVLIPEGIGLLFEELGLDDTLDAHSAVALVRDLAALRPVPDARQARFSALLSEHLQRASALVRARSQLMADAQDRHLHLSRGQLSAAERILEHAPSAKIIGGLDHVPREVATLALHDFLSDYGSVERAAAEVQKTWKAIDGVVLPTAMTELDLSAEARALRDNGGFFAFVFGAPAAYARDRVKPHLAARHQNITPVEMADVLDRVSAYRSTESRLRGLVESAHPWVPWAVNVTNGRVSQRRVASLRWMLTEVEAGNLGSAEISMLSEDSHRRLLTRDPAISWSKALRESGPEPDAACVGGLVVPVERFANWLAHPPQGASEEFDEFVRALYKELPQLASALFVADAARADRGLRGAVRGAVALSQGAFGPADQNRSKFRAIVERVRDEAGAARAILEPLRPQHPHAAYDENILGVSPDYVVRINDQVLTEVDGPMLKYGLQEMDRRELWVPKRAADKPDRDRLAARFEVFKNAG